MLKYNVESAEIFIYDEIGPSYWGLVGADEVSEALAQMSGKRVTVRLNSPGGSVDEGVAIYNAMRRHAGGLTVIVDGLAASMASYLLQAGEERVVASNSMVMVHDPWTIAIGNAEQLRKGADVLDKYRDRLVPDYANRSGRDADDIRAMMAEETWMAGQEIVNAGFADRVEDGADVAPSGLAFLGKIANKIPKQVFERAEYCRKMMETPYPRKAAAAKMFAEVFGS